jgi:glyoxylase-like metal-dependent hydrolase (beta-lactamase superfamily II)
VRFGSYDVSIVSDGSYRLDGGSMFGVVPKVLWEPLHPADEFNRIELALHALLLVGEGRVVLVDTGMGQGWTEKETAIYALARPEGDLVDALRRRGVEPDSVTDVLLTHLHFDHTGGTVTFDADGAARLTFPNATHWVQAQNLRWAAAPTERDRRSFRSDRWELLLEHEDRLRQLTGPTEVLPGVHTFVVHGHTPGQQLVWVGEEDGSGLLFCGDLIPFASHLRIPYVTAFDLNPVITLSEKKEFLVRAAAEGWTLVFPHDPVIVAGTIEADDGVFRLKEQVEL